MAFSSLSSLRSALPSLSSCSNENGQDHISRLPNDVLRIILSILPKNSFKHTHLVCRRWNECTREVRYLQLLRSTRSPSYGLSWHQRIDELFLPRFAKKGKIVSLKVDELKAAPLSSWRVRSANRTQIALESSQGYELLVALEKKKPRVSCSRIPKYSPPAKITSLPFVTSYTLINGNQHEEKEPFAACEFGEDLFVKTQMHLIRYKIEQNRQVEVWKHYEPKIQLLGAISERIIVSENQADLGEITIKSLAHDGRYVMTYSSGRDLSLTRVIGSAMALVKGSLLEIKNLTPPLNTIWQHDFKSPIVNYCVNNLQIACLVENGMLHYWKIT